VLPPDEPPEGVQGTPLAEHRHERDGKGRFRPGKSTRGSVVFVAAALADDCFGRIREDFFELGASCVGGLAEDV
jgi:hypothetical protein